MNRLQIFQNRNLCPSFVFASAQSAEKICRLFIAEKPPGFRDHAGRPHFSDMYALVDLVESGSELIEQSDLVRDYEGSDGWDKSPLIHFSNSSMAPKNLAPRFKHIPLLVKG